MPDAGLSALGGGIASGIGALFGGSAQSAAAEEQARLTQEAIDLQREIYGQQQELLAPYVAAGTEIGLPGLVGLTTPTGQAEFLGQYFQSPQFQTLQTQSQQDLLAAQAAQGQIGGSTTANQLQRIAPTLGLEALSQQQQQYGQLAGIGQAAATGTAQFGGQYGATTASLLQNLGTAQGQQAAAIPSAFGTAFGQVGGFALGRGLEGLF